VEVDKAISEGCLFFRKLILPIPSAVDSARRKVPREEFFQKWVNLINPQFRDDVTKVDEILQLDSLQGTEAVTICDSVTGDQDLVRKRPKFNQPEIADVNH
jgi:hypothetical protein